MRTSGNAGSQAVEVEPHKSAAFRFVTVAVSVAALCALAVDYGWRPLPGPARWTVRTAEVLVVGFFVAHSVLRLWWAHRKLQHLRSVWYEFVLIGLLAAALVTVGMSEPAQRAAYYSLTVQITIFLFLFIRITELVRVLSTSRFRPAQIFVTSFAMLIAVGLGLLMLPAATGHQLIVARGERLETLRGNILRQDDGGLWIQSARGIEFFPPADPAVRRTIKAEPAHWTTALFTATSAVCVTGLIVESTGGYWSPFGQTVILVLIQLGGLGIMTFGAVFALLLWQNLGLRQSAVMKDMVSPTMQINIGRVLVFILLSTAVLEALGTWSLWHLWSDAGMTVRQRLFYSVFHAVSAFCNAGFCLYGDSIERYRNTWQANGMFPLLIIVGGLGFMVTYNLSRIGRCHLRRTLARVRGHIPKPELDRRRLTLQSKLVLLTSAVLLVAGTGLVMLFETLPGRSPAGDMAPPARAAPSPADPSFALQAQQPVMARARPAERLAYSWFQSVTARTAGFNTAPTRQLTDSSKMLTILLMFVGASPGSTGGGIKTATLAVIMCGIWSLLTNRARPQAFKRNIPPNILLRSLVIMTLAGGVVVGATMILSVTQNGLRFLDALFESTSAFGTVGLSTGVTPALNWIGRLLIIVVMFAGRVGPLTLFIALPLGVKKYPYAYPTETVAIG